MKTTFTQWMCTFILLGITLPVWANTAEPLAMIVLVEFAPDDLQLSLRLEGDITSRKDTILTEAFYSYRKAWETRYSFRWSGGFDNEDIKSATLIVSSQGETFEIPLPSIRYYRNWYTLDLKRQTLIEEQTAGRITLLVSLRVICTLLLEGGIFFLFGFRQRRSWIMFFIINLLTQGILNLSLTEDTFATGYLLLFLIFAEIFIVLVEAIAFLLAVREHRVARKLLYVLIANIASLWLGGLLIDYLPV